VRRIRVAGKRARAADGGKPISGGFMHRLDHARVVRA
jgi:hypothetical protein